jgi:predicted nucleic acid-binding protein
MTPGGFNQLVDNFIIREDDRIERSAMLKEIMEMTFAERTAEVRAHYNLKLADSFQVAAAIVAGCDAFLTNDFELKRVSGINILVLDELEV